MAEPTLYLFDGFNLLHAGAFADLRSLRDALASFVAVRGARGVLVLDGHGPDETIGPLSVRYSPHADTLIERLAAEDRATEHVLVVSSDRAVRGATGRDVDVVSSRTFLADLGQATQPRSDDRGSQLADRLDPETRARLERLRRAR